MIESNETSVLAWANWQHSAGNTVMDKRENIFITTMYLYSDHKDIRCFIPESVKYFVANNELFNRN